MGTDLKTRSQGAAVTTFFETMYVATEELGNYSNFSMLGTSTLSTDTMSSFALSSKRNWTLLLTIFSTKELSVNEPLHFKADFLETFLKIAVDLVIVPQIN